MQNTNDELELMEPQVSYEKPAISTYTEIELLDSIEVWGASGSRVS